jgi:uncharacterized protein
MTEMNFYNKILYVFFTSLILCLVATVNVNAQATFPKSELTINTDNASYDFNIELAIDDSHREYGLMFRTEMPEMNGMLFIYDEMRNVSMWMKNTFISLDIVFIDEVGKITNIAESQQPRSLSLIRSGGEVKAVLELNGGLAKKLGIEVGDQINYPIFENALK